MLASDGLWCCSKTENLTTTPGVAARKTWASTSKRSLKHGEFHRKPTRFLENCQKQNLNLLRRQTLQRFFLTRMPTLDDLSLIFRRPWLFRDTSGISSAAESASTISQRITLREIFCEATNAARHELFPWSRAHDLPAEFPWQQSVDDLQSIRRQFDLRHLSVSRSCCWFNVAFIDSTCAHQNRASIVAILILQSHL